ncbi:DUF2510 domain-containing protein [Rhodococcus sp. O3]|uniref:DUF2510 domain-containing protein n=1 Tax=Rhodococcus sp. O3 TaxID=3404919 RepID=UPI003B67E7BE
MTEPRALGWHPDPHTDGLHRWWNGEAWTALVRPAPRPSVEIVDVPLEDTPGTSTRISTDAKRALFITGVAVVAFALWGYIGLTRNSDPAEPSPPVSSVAEPIP